MRERVVLVRVALGAAHGEAQPDGAGHGDAVDHRVEPVLQRVDPALLVEHRVAVEAGRHAVPHRGVGQQVPGELADGEVVERHPGVQRPHDPVAVGPDRAGPVLLVPVRVRVAGQVQPGPRPPLAVAGRGEQPVDQPVVGVRPRVGGERVGLRGRGRQPGQVQRHAADQRVPVRRRRRGEAATPEGVADEGVQRIAGRFGGGRGTRDEGRVPRFRISRTQPSSLVPRPPHRGNLRPHRRDERPVRLVLRPLFDPRPQQGDLGVRERRAGFGRGHHGVPVVRGDAGEQFARLAVAGDDRGVPAEVGRGGGGGVEPQVVLRGLPVRPVTGVTPPGQQRADIAVERDGFGPVRRGEQDGGEEGGDRHGLILPGWRGGIVVRFVVRSFSLARERGERGRERFQEPNGNGVSRHLQGDG